jgi:uncharacterized protein (TIGR00255 family)
MTAFARTTGQTAWGEVTCELRSVNHRYLEVNPRLSDEVRRLEPQVRDVIARHLSRGRVDCNIRLQQQDVPTGNLDVDMDLMDELIGVAGRVAERVADIEPLGVADLLRWPGVVRAARVDEELIEKVSMDCLERAVKHLVEIRQREGGRLLESLRQKLDAAKTLVSELRRSIPSWQHAFRQRVEARLAEARLDLDPSRLEQEMLFYVQKADVTEELDRLEVHLGEVSEVFGQTQPVGRRLDFMMQELNREANTLGSKSNDARLTQATVDLKVLIEQMREQVQNIE